MDRRFVLGLMAACSALGLMAPAKAMSNSQLARKSIVKVSNAIEGSETFLSIDDLKDLPVTTLRTITPWTDGVNEFEGIYLADLAKQYGEGASTVRALAFNDYQIEFELADAIEKEAFLAFRQDGRQLSTRNRGPYWVVFPWSERPELDKRTVHGLSIWQLVDLSFQ